MQRAKLLTRINDSRRDEITRIGDIFGAPFQFAGFYAEPKCEHYYSADRHEDREPISQVRARPSRGSTTFCAAILRSLATAAPRCSFFRTPGCLRPR